MIERRQQRSERPAEALNLLLTSVRRRSQVSSIAIIDGRGLIVAGDGPEDELYVLGAVAEPAASTEGMDPVTERLTAGTDVMSCPLTVDGTTLYLAALGGKVSRMHEAARSVERILATG